MFDRYRRRTAEQKARATVDALERARDVAGLAELLRGGGPEAVIRAGAALGRIGGRDAVEALLAALDGASVDTGREIVRGLGADRPRLRSGPIGDPIAVEPLIGWLHDSEVAGDAAVALARIGGRGVVEALLAALDGVRGDARVKIVRSLGTIGDPIATDTLIGLLHDREDVWAAAPALAEIGGRQALHALVDAVTDPDFPGSRAPLQEALSRLIRPLGVPKRLPGYLTRDAVAEVRRLMWAGDLDAAQILLGHIRKGISLARITGGMPWGLASHAGAAVDRASSEVSRQEMVANQSVRPKAHPFRFGGLRELSPWGELARLELLLATVPEGLEVAAAPSPVDVQVDEPTIELMIRLLRGSDDETAALRRDTLICLHRMDRLGSVADLGGTLDDRHWAVRLAAIAVLRKIDDPEATAVLRTKMGDENQDVRTAAVAVAVPKDGHILLQAVRDPRDDIRAQAAMSAADLDDPQWADVLAPLLTDAEPLARRSTGAALHRWEWTGDPVQAAISARAWDDVAAAGAAAARPLMRMFEETYRDHDPDKEAALQTLERLVITHGRAIPDDVLRAGADFEDFAGVLEREPDSDHLLAPMVNASRLRQACQKALQARDGGRRSTAG